MLHDFAQPVCRACCNYEGVDHIAEAIDKAMHMRRAFSDLTTSPSSDVPAVKTTHHTDLVNLMPAVTVATTRPAVRPTGPTYACIPQPQVSMVSTEAKATPVRDAVEDWLAEEECYRTPVQETDPHPSVMV